MKSWSFLFILLGIAASCGLYEIGGNEEESSSGGIWGGPIENEQVQGTMNSVCYMTVLEYPDGYDWRSDEGVGAVRCSLVVYMEGRPIMKVPVGDKYEVSSAPDMHRMIDGHLYTDYSTHSETVIKKDGFDIFRYEGRERLCGVEVVGDDVYTLGEDRSGNGFTYRKNAEILIERENGSVIGELRLSDDSLSFAFAEYIQTSEGQEERYYLVRNGKVSQIAVREDIKKVWDILPYGDEIIYVATLTGIQYPVLMSGEDMKGLYITPGSQMISCRLLASESDVCVDGLYSLPDGSVQNGLWINGMSCMSFPKNMYISSMAMLRHDVFCALNPSVREECGIIYHAGQSYPIPQGYLCVSNEVLAVINGFLYVGLSSSENEAPIVWKDGKLDSLDINGYISSISSKKLNQ